MLKGPWLGQENCNELGKDKNCSLLLLFLEGHENQWKAVLFDDMDSRWNGGVPLCWMLGKLGSLLLGVWVYS